MTFRYVSGVLAFCALLSLSDSLHAQDFPNRAVRIIVGISPEGSLRLMADKLQAEFGRPIVVEPRAGAAGEIALKAVAAADPDGYTLMYASSNTTLAKAMGTATVDIVEEFEPVALLGQSAFTMVINKDLPATTPQEFVALAKAKPGALNCGSTGVGTPGHLGCAMLNKMAGVDIVHVPYRNAAEGMNGLVSNQVQVLFSVSSAARPQIEGGAVRGLAVAVEEPTLLIPGLQTMQSFGFPGFIVKGWGVFVAPKGTPKPVIAKINAAIVRILQDPEVQSKMLQFGLAPGPAMTPEQVGSFMRSEVDRWNRTIDLTGVPRGRPQ
jgi:tripartite-type tricarboxylate transporter receptor subunit TctC